MGYLINVICNYIIYIYTHMYYSTIWCVYIYITFIRMMWYDMIWCDMIWYTVLRSTLQYDDMVDDKGTVLCTMVVLYGPGLLKFSTIVNIISCSSQYIAMYIYMYIYIYNIQKNIKKNTFPNPVFWMLCLKPLGSSKLSDIDHFIVPELVWGKKTSRNSLKGKQQPYQT